MSLRERLLMKELEQANCRLNQISRQDTLTEVANRRHFDDFLQHVWGRAQRDGLDVSLMMIDVDHFKAYNDHYGHPAGDACLKDIATALKRQLRGSGDLIARFGGEEFIAVLTNTSLAVATAAAERVREGVTALQRPHAASPALLQQVTVSIGVASLRPDAHTPRRPN